MIRILALILLTIGFSLYCPEVLQSQGSTLSEESLTWQSGQVPLNGPEQNISIAAVLESLSDIENLVINMFPGGAVLGGKLLNPEDMNRVVLLSESQGNILNLCSFHPDALQIAASHLERILIQNQITGLKLSPLGNALLLTGTPVENEDIARVQRICDSLHIPLTIGTHSAISDPRMVFFEVSFVEVNKDTFNDLGIQWPASSSISDPAGMRIGHMAPSNNLEITIDHQVIQGKAKIISRPRLICASGQKASFQAGGEIPIPRSDGEGGISITWKPYGIILEVAPSIDSQDKIHIQIRSEVSMVDHANAINGVPGILTRRVETYLSLETGQTVVLSGLVHSDDAKNIQKVPFLGDIPIFGELFKSSSFQKRETELVVFLTPLPTTDDSHLHDKWRPIETVKGLDVKPGQN